MNELRVRVEGPDAIDTILDLRRAVFPDEELDKQDPRYFRWAFEDGRHGPARFYIAEDEGGRVAGSYTVVPQRFALAAETVAASIVVDVMTHPEFRMRGVFTTLGRAAMTDNTHRGIAFACGYPVRPEVMPGHLKVGWRELFGIRVVVRPLDIAVLAARALPAPLARIVDSMARPLRGVLAPRAFGTVEDLGELRPGALDGLGAELDELWERTRARAGIQQVRDRAYLEWRYGQHPTRTYRGWTIDRKSVV